MGEETTDRLGLLQQLAAQTPHPESVPINMLVRVEGTPLEETKPIDPFDMVRMVATARIIMPSSYVRLSAGRMEMSDEMQALCFVAGANSVFSGDTLLTTPNPGDHHDNQLLHRLGMEFMNQPARPVSDGDTAGACSGGGQTKAAPDAITDSAEVSAH